MRQSGLIVVTLFHLSYFDSPVIRKQAYPRFIFTKIILKLVRKMNGSPSTNAFCLGPCSLVGEEREWGGDHHCSLWCLATGEIPRLSQAFTGSTTILVGSWTSGTSGISHSLDVAPRTVDQAGLPPRPVHSPRRKLATERPDIP